MKVIWPMFWGDLDRDRELDCALNGLYVGLALAA